ncbi:MAG TPA: sulfite exporter TauE/SafE family protein [Stellaceae bacterium]|nr:sulfite exporter TauE/SafE family protein [Stellaceae bacterium]
MASLSVLGLYALVMVGAFAVRSAAGFGAVLVAMPLLAFIMPLTKALAATSVLTALTSIHHVGRNWRHVAWSQFLKISTYTVIGLGLGFYCLHLLNEETLKRSLGAFLILYALYALWTVKVPRVVPARWHGKLAAGAGFFGGFFGALFGGGIGPIYVIYFNAMRMERDAFRATMSILVLLTGAARIAGYAAFGFYERSTAALIAIGLPMIVVGSWLGDRFAQRLDPVRFAGFIGMLILLSGIALVIK